MDGLHNWYGLKWAMDFYTIAAQRCGYLRDGYGQYSRPAANNGNTSSVLWKTEHTEIDVGSP